MESLKPVDISNGIYISARYKSASTVYMSAAKAYEVGSPSVT